MSRLFLFGGKKKLPLERGGRGLLQRHNLYACPVGDSLWSPIGAEGEMELD